MYAIEHGLLNLDPIHNIGKLTKGLIDNTRAGLWGVIDMIPCGNYNLNYLIYLIYRSDLPKYLPGMSYDHVGSLHLP